MSRRPPASTFQELILRLQEFWSDFGCLIGQPFDVEKGAGTYNMHTFLRALGPEPWKVAYVEPSRRPADGRYGDNPNRLYRHHQFQVVLKPNPPDVQRIYLESMAAVGIHPDEHDIRFVEDNWESPTLGAWGLGWEVWVDGMELTQFTYFQQCGGLECRPVSAELTYGLERIAMYLQNVDNVFDVVYAPGVKYREVFHRDEYEYSKFTFEELNVEMYLQIYELCEKETQRLVEKKLVVPAYDHLMKAAHAFNSLDARGAISVTERQGYILRIRDLAKLCAEGYLELRSSLHFPLMAGGGTEDMSPRELEPVESTPRGAPHRAELFLEVGSEELPAGEVMNAVEHVRNKLVAGLKELGLSHGEPRIFATPRRIAVVIPDVPDRQEDRTVEHSGPPTKSGDTAAAKFAEKVGLKLDQLQKRETKKGEYWFAQVSEKGKATLSLLADIMRNAIATIEFKRSMRWANETETYSRPIRWIAALFDNRCVPFTYAGITADRISKGHRFLAPHDFKIESAAQYEAELTKRKVVADPVRRREMIVEGARKLAAKAGGKLHQDDALLDQIAQLVENPVPLLNHFDEKYLEIPDEVLISEMQHHQRYLPIVDAKGKLMPNFVVVANTTVADEKVSLDGYRRVLTARFEDGAFFFKEDQKKPLASRIDDLKKIRFHRDLGTIHEKVERTVDLAEALAKSVGEKTDESLKRAGWLMKADLTTHMVFEFPELQGVIGAEYARRGGEPEEIAAAIEEHYLPRGAEDRLPQGKLGALLGIADRFDSIAGIFSVGKGPTGSADPFGLRRASLGIIAILRQRGWHLPLEEAIGASLDRIGKKMKKDRSAVMVEISDFLRTRLKGVATGEGVPTDVAEAVLAAGYDDAIDVLARGQALAGLKKSPHFEPIAVTFKRVANILKQAGNVPAGSPAVDPAEKKLQDAIAKVSGTVQASMKNRDYVAAFSAIAQLRPTVAEFFDAVMVMDEDPTVRARRIGLVAAVQKLFAPLADFTKLS